MRNFFKDLGRGIASIFKGPAHNDNLYRLDNRVPLSRAIPFGIQHILAMFAANITPIIIVFGARGLLGTDFATRAMLSALFMAGIGTVVQLFIGARLPIVVGTSFTFVGVFIAMTNGITGEDAYYTIMGSIMVGGLFIAVLAFLYRFWGKIIKPIVPAVVVLSIGLSLMEAGATQFVGGASLLGSIVGGTTPAVPYYCYIIVAVVTILAALLWSLLMKGVWKSINIVVGIAAGYIVACCIPGMVDFSGMAIDGAHLVGSHGVFSFPMFLDFSKLIFKPVPILMTCICFLVGSVEAIGDSSALTETGLGRLPTSREFTGLLASDGLISAVGACFGSLPLTTFSQNVGIVSQTKVVNRFTIFLGSCLLILAGFFPPIANFLYTIPDCVLGGTMVILFGSITVVGMKMAAEQGFSEKNIMILSLCLCLGFGLTLAKDFYTVLESYGLGNLGAILGNPTINMFVLAIILSWVLPDNMHIGKKVKQ